MQWDAAATVSVEGYGSRRVSAIGVETPRVSMPGMTRDGGDVWWMPVPDRL